MNSVSPEPNFIPTEPYPGWTPWTAAHLKPWRLYLICATQRTGSNLLCDLLQQSGAGGRPSEHFTPVREAWQTPYWGVSSFAEYFDRAIFEATGSNGVCGIKIMWLYLDHLVDELRGLFGLPAASTAQILNAAFPNARYIWMSRRDKVRQAVSLYRARETRIWRASDRLDDTPVEPAFDFLNIDRLVQEVSDHDAAWGRYFEANGISPFHVVYEDLVRAQNETVIQVLEYLGIPIPEPFFGGTMLQKQADALSAEWVHRYHALKEQQLVQGWSPVLVERPH